MATILLADKDKPSRDMYRAAITKYLPGGHTILEVDDGAVALRLALERRPAAIITELMLPHVAGADLVRQVRDSVGGHATVVIVVTGRGLPSDEQMSEDAGADAFVTKPCSMHELCETLGALLAKARK